MKKLIYSAAAMAIAFFAASCQQENLEPAATSNTVTYTVQVADALATKALGDDVTAVDKVYYEVYRAAEVKDLSKSPVYQGEKPVINNSASFDLEFVKNQNFVVLFWAQNEDLQMFDIVDLRKVTLTTPGDSNNANAQVFAGSDTVTNCNSAVGGKVTLTRPISQLNIFTTKESLTFGTKKITLSESTVTVDGLYTTYNVAEGAAVVTPTTAEFTYDAATVPATQDTDPYAYVAMNYVGFAPNASTTVQVDFTITTSEGNVSHSVSSVPVKPNFRTNIVGNLLTESTDYNVTLNDSWATPENVYSIWDGQTVTEPAFDATAAQPTYVIDEASDFAWFAAAVNGTLPQTRSGSAIDNFQGKTFVLTSDIDLGGHEWTPISMSTNLAGGETFRGTFDGNGHTIYGLTCTNNEVASLFGYVYACTIKNVTVDGARLSSNHYAGGIVGWVLNNTGNIQVPFVLENCHVKNSVISSTPEFVNGEWDNGDKVGGLVGYAVFTGNTEAKISNCSVENTTVKAYRDFAGLVGYAKDVAIQNCSTENVTLEQDLTHDYKAPNTPTTVGEFIGRNEGGNTIDGNEYLADGVLKDNEGNYHIYNAAALMWVSKQVNTMEFYVNQAANIFDGKTVFIEKDIDLNGAEWTPIGDYAFSRTSFNGIFDGKNHTISNFKVTNPVAWTEKVTEASYGFFGNVKGSIKNVTIKNATVNPEGGRYAAALVGRLHNGGNIENCHVVSSSVTINHWQVGGIVGQNNNGNIKSCSVTGSTITGKAAVGAIVGMDMTAGEHTIENCRIIDNALVQNASFGASYDASYGLAVGLVNASGIILHLNNISMENNTIKGVAANTLVGDKENGAIVYLNGSLPVSTAEELDAAIKAGGKYILTNNIAVKVATYQNVDFELDGNGYTISQAEGSTNTYGLFDSVTGKLTFKNVVFDSIKEGAVVRTTGAEFTLDNVTVKNCQHTQIYGLFRLIGKNVIKNSTFENNNCTTVITFNTEGDDNTDPQLVQNCEFKNNTCSATAVVHYSTGGSATIDGNKFLNNTLAVSNGATLYMGFKKNCTVTNNLFDGNAVTATSKRSSGGLMIGNASVVTGNAFVNNTVTVNGQTGYGNDVCASPYYAAIDLSGNYWGGDAPVENDDYYKEYNNYEVIINDYLTANPFN